MAPQDQVRRNVDREQHWAKVDARRQRPVQWLSPKELARTGAKAAQATMFGEFADKREVEAGFPAEYYDFSESNADDFWLDYVADIGDGFNATYAVAGELAKDTLTVGGIPTERGRLLVLGGDEVYPTGSAKNYTDRTTGPYGAALPERTDASPAVLAVPGNHDWYDGLSSFLRVFCQSWLMDPRRGEFPADGRLRRVPEENRTNEFMGGWRTLQSRSYFAAKLPHNWWVWGIDIQFDTFIDAPQLAYFLDAAKLIGDGNLILCTAKPSWVHVEDEQESYDILRWFLERVLGDNVSAVRMMVSGDTHHYARYALRDDGVAAPQTLITCGGGGAYLAATHQLPPTLPLTAQFRAAEDDPPPACYDQRCAYPDPDDSATMARRGFWAIPHRNWSLGILIGILYALLVLLATVAQEHVAPGFAARLDAFDLTTTRPSPAVLPALLLAALVVWGTIGLAMPEKGKPHRWRRTAVGAAHGLLHLALALGTGTVLARLPLLEQMRAVAYGIGFTAAVAVVGGIVGSFLTAFYLWLASTTVRVNTNELFAGMHVQDHKSFLRLQVSARTHELIVHPIKVPSVPRRWRFNAAGKPGDGLFEPVGGTVTPALIEDPIRISPRTIR